MGNPAQDVAVTRVDLTAGRHTTMQCVGSMAVRLVALAVACEAFSPAMPAGLRTPMRAAASSGRSEPRVGVRTLRAMAANEQHAATAMDWDTLASFPWGSIETESMTVAKCGPETGGEWKSAEVVPYGNLPMPPKAGVLNYGQGLFEGMKAQRTEDGRIVIFRPEKNAKRCYYGCERLLMPPVPEDIFTNAVKDCVIANAKWVPPKGKGSLYLRTIVIGSGPILGLAPAPSYTLCCYVSPVGSYFKGNQLTPIKLKLETGFSRAAPGGSGGVKAIGNYAPSLMPQKKAKEEGFDNVIYLDAAEKKYLEEVGTSNVFIVKGKKVLTPALKGNGDPEDTILEGVTRDSLITLLKDKGYEVVETRVSIDDLLESDEAFTVGTAVVISPIGEVSYMGKPHQWNYADGSSGPVTKDLYETLVGIQTGTHPDPYGWTVYLD